MKNKLYFFIAFFIASFFEARSQNLVPNWSFEKIDSCITGWGEFDGYVADWMGQTGAGSGLSYFTHQCPGDSSGGGSVPYNLYNGNGFQYAHSGVSYAAIVSFVTLNSSDSTYPYGNTVGKNQRNYIQVALTDSLISGSKYFVCFFVNLQNASNYACSDIGAYFSKNAPTFNSNGDVLSYIPQISNNPKKEELTDTLYWMKVSGSFVANGGEKYLTIGNFKNDSLSSIRYLGQITATGNEAWYYIDDVIVSADSNYADSLFTGVNELRITNYEFIRILTTANLPLRSKG